MAHSDCCQGEFWESYDGGGGGGGFFWSFVKDWTCDDCFVIQGVGPSSFYSVMENFYVSAVEFYNCVSSLECDAARFIKELSCESIFLLLVFDFQKHSKHSQSPAQHSQCFCSFKQ